jgi:bifunctional pyridoxal-dependent enzyme with beta-cystathionase and maltose regulon repressor activities
MKLSVILTGRDDNYGENFIERLNQCLDNNIRLLNKNKIDYEIICVDFNPIDGKYLHNNEVIKEKLSQDKIKNIIIDNSVIIAENLSPSNYYEYFAKNAGVRRSIGDFLFMS